MPPACLCKMQLCPASRRGEANALAHAPPPPLQRARLLPVHRSRSPQGNARACRERFNVNLGRGGSVHFRSKNTGKPVHHGLPFPDCHTGSRA